MNGKKPICRQEILSITPYVPGKPIEEVKRELGLTNVIKLASNENPLGASPKAVEAVKSKAAEINMYPDGSCYELKESIAEYYEIDSDKLLIGNGSDEIIKLIAESFLNPGEEVIIPNPSFSEYEFAAKIMGGNCIYSPLKDFRIDLKDMLEKINSRTKIIFVCNPNNPTGTIVTDNEVRSFLDKVPNDILVIFDEAYYEYVTSEYYPSTLDFVKSGFNNVMVLRTFSKIYGLAGTRVGYAVAGEDLTASVNRVREPFNVNMLAQTAALAALKDEGFVDKSCKVNNAGKSYLYEELEKLGIKYWPTEANFIWVDFGRDCREVFEKMLAQGVIIRTGDVFGYNTYGRITIGDENQNDKLISALKKVI